MAKQEDVRRIALAVRVRDQAEKAALLAGAPEVFFSEPHYDGFPAVLVRLPKVTPARSASSPPTPGGARLPRQPAPRGE
jgi:hypothetical protein